MWDVSTASPVTSNHAYWADVQKVMEQLPHQDGHTAPQYYFNKTKDTVLAIVNIVAGAKLCEHITDFVTQYPPDFPQ